MAQIEIKHRFSDTVLFVHETTKERQASGLAIRDALEAATKDGVDLGGVDLRGAYLRGAYLSDADLSGAYLSGANLGDANLSDADLSGAKWRYDITINRVPLQVAGLHWVVYILDQHMQVGCELHTLAEWAEFDDARIVQMDGKNALRFWRAHKIALLALAASDGRGVAAEAEQEAA